MNDDQTTLGCARAHELAGAWIDGELGQDRELHLHLAQCAECREFVEHVRAMRGELSGLASARRVDVWPRIEASLGAPARRSPAWRWPARLAAALVGGIGVSTFLRDVERRPAERDGSLTSSLTHISSITSSPTDLLRVAESPERTLLLALATRDEERR